MTLRIFRLFMVLCLLITTFSNITGQNSDTKEQYLDKPFKQEYHIGYHLGTSNKENDVRAIAVDSLSNIWAASKYGIFVKSHLSEEWIPAQNKSESGPSFDVEVDSDNGVWFATWNGLYKSQNNKVVKYEEIKPPVSKIISTEKGVYVFGHYGVWLIQNEKASKIDLVISKGVRDVIQDNKDGLWIATDVGLYHYNDDQLKLYQDTKELLSCYASSVAYSSKKNLWVATLGGVTIRNDLGKIKTLTPSEGIPNGEVNCIRKSADNAMWVGTNMGVVRYYNDGTSSLRFSKRWLVNDKVNDIEFDKEGTAWIATANGISAIKSKELTLSEKADYFYKRLMQVHVRDPWIVHLVALENKGDSSSWKPTDDDNDGEYTGIYLSMESLRYAATGDPVARERSKKAFHTLKYLQEVTETDGFFARTVIPINWTTMHDLNRKYSEREYADELVKDPRFKRVENRWRESSDGKWLWKGDTSSDEMCGHFMGYFYYYEFAADESEKEIIRMHVKKIVDYLMTNNYNFLDIDGTPTRWAVWSPDKLNRDPDWSSEKSLNSFELLSYLKFTAHITGEQKYEDEYKRLIDEEGYLKNMSQLNRKNPAWEIYFDILLEAYLFPILIKYEEDPDIKKFYENLMDEWFVKQIDGKNPLNNFVYSYTRGVTKELNNSIEFLIDTPLDLVDYNIDHTQREDVQIVRKPILEEKQINVLPPASERATVRWDKNPWAAIHGNPYTEREPVFWLFPYWMGKYLEIIVE